MQRQIEQSDFRANGEAARCRATVKWFNVAKGFGFVTPVDGTAEAFLHLSVLKQAGFEAVAEGAGMLVEISQSPKGRQVVRVLDVDLSTAQEVPQRPRMSGGHSSDMEMPSAEDASPMDGVVKWFSALKGYGFVSPNDGSKDIFLHITILRNAGLSGLTPGQTVRMRVVNARKGPEAVAVELASPPGPGDAH